MKCILILIFGVLLLSCSEDKYFKERFDEMLRVTNHSAHVITRLKVYGEVPGSKAWVLEDLQPDEQRSIRFNIKRDLKTREGGLSIVAFFDDSDSLSTAIYYTNWQVIGDLIDVEIYDNKRLVVKN